MIRTSASEISPGGAGLADREPLAEVVQADPGRDQQRELLRRRQPLERTCAPRTRRPRPRPGRRAAWRAACASSGRSRRGSSGRRRSRRRAATPSQRKRPRSAAVDRVLSALLDRLDAVREHVPEQEEQDPGRDGGEPGAHADVEVLQPRRPAGRGRSCTPAIAPRRRICVARAPVVVRVTLHRRRTIVTSGQLQRVAQGHSVDEYLETIYFLAFPIGEYRPADGRLPHARLARRRDARRLARVGRRDAEAARGRGADRARRAQGGAPHGDGPRARRARRPQAPDHRAAAHRLHGLHGRRGARARRRARRHVHATTWSSGSREQLGHPDRCPHGWPVDPDVEQAENAELDAARATCEPGTRATIVRLAEHDGELLHWFYDEGLVPGSEIEVRAVDRQPLQRSPSNGGERAIGEKAAAGLFVRPACVRLNPGRRCAAAVTMTISVGCVQTRRRRGVAAAGKPASAGRRIFRRGRELRRMTALTTSPRETALLRPSQESSAGYAARARTASGSAQAHPRERLSGSRGSARPAAARSASALSSRSHVKSLVLAAEVAVRGGLRVDRPAQVEVAQDRAPGAGRSARATSSSIRSTETCSVPNVSHGDRHRVRDADRVGDVDLGSGRRGRRRRGSSPRSAPRRRPSGRPSSGPCPRTRRRRARAAPPYVSTMILRPVRPVSPIGPPIDELAGRVAVEEVLVVQQAPLVVQVRAAGSAAGRARRGRA